GAKKGNAERGDRLAKDRRASIPCVPRSGEEVEPLRCQALLPPPILTGRSQENDQPCEEMKSGDPASSVQPPSPRLGISLDDRVRLDAVFEPHRNRPLREQFPERAAGAKLSDGTALHVKLRPSVALDVAGSDVAALVEDHHHRSLSL